jgi:hypothetical protein
MRPVTINTGAKDPAVAAALAEIQRASHEADLMEIFQNFTIIGTFTVNRTLVTASSVSPLPSTLNDVVNFLCTMISDIKTGGLNRTT